MLVFVKEAKILPNNNYFLDTLRIVTGKLEKYKYYFAIFEVNNIIRRFKRVIYFISPEFIIVTK